MQTLNVCVGGRVHMSCWHIFSAYTVHTVMWFWLDIAKNVHMDPYVTQTLTDPCSQVEAERMR